MSRLIKIGIALLTLAVVFPLPLPVQAAATAFLVHSKPVQSYRWQATKWPGDCLINGGSTCEQMGITL